MIKFSKLTIEIDLLFHIGYIVYGQSQAWKLNLTFGGIGHIF